MASVKLDAIRKVYDNGFVAVHDANFEIADGEFVVLVGPSGCGKSTTLRMIAGLESVTSGDLLLDGKRVNDVPPKDRDIAMVFQNYALYPHMTVFDNMAFGLKLRKYPKDEIRSRVEDAAGILGIDAVLDRKPGALSGGQRQRVAVGRAIVRKPSVFLFDEPLSNLDAKLRVQMRTEISKLHRKLGATMVYVTHDQVEAMTMGDRIVVMKDGFIQQVAPPLDLYDSPANQFVASFIGSPSMNFLEGKISTDGSEFVLSESDSRVRLGPAASNEPRDIECTLGIRPEHIKISGEGGVRAVVEVVEPMGNETVLYTRVGNETVVCRLAPNNLPAPGNEVYLEFDPEKLHFFSGESAEGVKAA